jgi:aminoglycoside phosphotransferase (APT) family kinase protein
VLDSLFALLDYLDTASPQASQQWHEWSISPISGGANNLLYQATNTNSSYAVKFTVRDDRNRATREYAALTALQQAGLRLAPCAIWVDNDRYRQPVIVQTWLDGIALTSPPTTDADWEALLRHYCAIHSVTPAHTTIALADAVINVASGAAGKALIQHHAAKLPLPARPDSLQRILGWLDGWLPPVWPSSPRALCRVDSNWRNFIRRSGDWASVDWENSGWGDPAFELADLMTHPAYDNTPPARWQQLIRSYIELRDDRNAVVRIQTYYTIMLVWWVVRGARYLYEVPRGLDPRLVSRPANWLEEMQQKYARFVARAEAHIATL